MAEVDQDDSLLSRLLEHLGVEDIGSYMLYHDAIGTEMWSVVLTTSDGKTFDLPKEFITPGEALNYLHRWAQGRGLIVTITEGKIRRYKDSVEARMNLSLKDEV